MADLSPPLTQPNNQANSTREDLTTRRIRVFAQRYGEKALFLAYHAAFPLTLTSDLLYCLRENFVTDCPWYAVADVLQSGLCQPAGYDLYEMEGKTRDALLRRLCNEFGEQRLKELANFMSQYVTSRLRVEDNNRALVFGERPNWTALAYMSPDAQELIDIIKQELQRLTASADAKERIRWGVLVENYAELLTEKGFQPLLLEWAQQIFDGEPIQDEEEKQVAAVMGVFLQPFDFDVAVITPDITSDNEPGEELQSFEFETVTVDARGQVINKEPNQAFYFVEVLGGVQTSPTSNYGQIEQTSQIEQELDNLQPEQEEPVALGIEMVAIPGGTFEMGSPENEPERHESESPQHTVTVQPFFISKYPVTQAQWLFIAQLPQINQELDPEPSRFKGANRPVERVSWYDAVEFCSRLSQYTGRPYSLPSEAEWEYACRAGTTTPFHFGETITSELANYDANYTYGAGVKGTYREETTSVGSFGVANAFGLYDMHGNVWEWCADHWHENYQGAPTDGSAWLTNNNFRLLLRGGSWHSYPASCRCAYRIIYNPEYHRNIGFRVVCTAADSLKVSKQGKQLHRSSQPIIVEGIAVISVENEDDDGNIINRTIEITPDDLDWEVDSADERQMGTETAYTATYYFDEGDIEWTVWEYPIGVTNYSDYKIEGGILVKNFDALEVINEDITELSDDFEQL
jgi:formylglycine-generating enzyme required for sulfatase activity